MLMMRPHPRSAIKGAAVVPQYVHPSEGRDGLLDQPARRAGFPEVVCEEHRLAARAGDLMDHLTAPGLVAAGDRDPDARFPEPPGDLRPDPRGRAGNDRNASWSYTHSSTLRLYLVNPKCV